MRARWLAALREFSRSRGVSMGKVLAASSRLVMAWRWDCFSRLAARAWMKASASRMASAIGG